MNSQVTPAGAQRELIKAGAGAGKTHTIQTRVTEWIQSGEVAADRILAVTFTVNAAAEMRNRIKVNLLKAGLRQEAKLLDRSTISTIHAFGSQVLKTFAYETGQSPSPRQLSEHEQKLLIRSALESVSSIDYLVDNLRRFGYVGTKKKDEFVDAVDQLSEMILSVMGKLRSLGKGGDISATEADDLLSAALEKIKTVYGHVQKDPTPLKRDLWAAIQVVRTAYPDSTYLMDKAEWGSNGKSRTFTSTVYNLTTDQLDSDWRAWANLQYVDDLKKLAKHSEARLAEQIWNAAEKLDVHPGPLKEALEHTASLLRSALDGLGVFAGLKREKGLVDYADMVQLSETTLKRNSAWLEEVASEYDCIIIDEFQDTNPLQYKLLRALEPYVKHTLIVGDLKQSIMGFQGSDSRLFGSMLESQAKVETLGGNWRSTPELMEFINAMGDTLYGPRYSRLTPKANYHSDLSALQLLAFEKGPWGVSGGKNTPGFTREGNKALANHLVKLLGSGVNVTDRSTKQKRPIRPSDIAVLASRHSRLENFASVLRQTGLSVQIKENGFLACPAVCLMLNALQFLNNPRDSYALLDYLTSPIFGDNRSEQLEELVTEYLKDRRFADERIVDLLSDRANLQSLSVKSQLIALVESSGVLDRVLNLPDGEQYRANLLRLIGWADNFENAQPETLQAMGLAGRNAPTFVVWLHEQFKETDEQALPDPLAENAITFKTWHACKGLEWPVVVILDAEKEFGPSVPDISMDYPDGGVDTMLEGGFAKYSPNWASPKVKEDMLDSLRDEELETRRNLFYVALTRAREQIILPVWEGHKDDCMLSAIGPAIETVLKLNDPKYAASKQVLTTEADTLECFSSATTRKVVCVDSATQATPISASVSPSELKGSEAVTLSLINTSPYTPPLDLSELTEHPANVIGTWMHRVYEVFFVAPERLDDALRIGIGQCLSDGALQSIKTHLAGLKSAIETTQGSDVTYRCEVPVLSLNQTGQIVSGTIDLVIESSQGNCLVDHKTDAELEDAVHLGQLAAYVGMNNSLNLASCALNWGKHGEVHTFTS